MGHMGITWDTWAMANGVSWLILQIELGHLGGWGIMGDGAHGQLGTWA